ncbi:ATP-dependent DNA helicase RecG [Dolosicoccus paucivorans]|uniref:ATP-dependent DNA helicase RecG n=1 Tax=Dolosicoccus paucivorans TaxID=84521 RepID=UPI00089144B4|nr:ATP-dependent DNA helicase RecG [Dolosicoccus paucivorans]PMB84476.1 ATP-dependent DNA helicase RecG [Dolosicoccus paucivorans]SDI62404.1 ATP-dependent DNA helicase RecG [Dolosicoccus paucivorans]
MSHKTWYDPINTLKGIGPARQQQFAKINVFTIKDLFFHFPFRYEDIRARELDSILDQEQVTLKGTIVSPPVVSFFGHKKSRLQFKLAVNDHDVIQVIFFNQPYLKKQFDVGHTVAIYGKWQSNQQSLLGMRVLNNQQSGENFAPIYNTTKGLSQKNILNTLELAFEEYGQVIPEILPKRLNEKYRLVNLKEALYWMHFPKNGQQAKQGKRKIIFQELFLYQWQLQQANQKHQGEPGVIVNYDVDPLKEVIDQLPYELTNAQKRVVNEICIDLRSPFPMRRLVQGDVGSGKTLVAFLAMIATIQAGYQTALMVPTEILAKQHAKEFNQLFESIGLRAELLISATPTKEKNNILDGLKAGRIRVVIGTHALIQPTVIFHRLGLVIIDEQHRFGVGQRQTLLDKGQGEEVVNLLQMTATPIPRSLALTIYGQLAVSTIDELPAGRQPITTRVLKPNQIEVVYDQMRQELQKGHQVYYVLPLIEMSEELQEVENVQAVVERLDGLFSNYTIGTMHGQMTKDEQEATMTDFSQNKVQILVATTMVEVGVNVPNATMMIIQSAERFGLAQLHQLRGRVGRSSLESYCYLIADPTTEQGRERMAIMEQSQDGFKISQEDMKIRGIGEVLGRSQSGLPQFKFANIFEDQHILQIAYQDVLYIMKHFSELSTQEQEELNKWVEMHLIEV